MKNPDATKEQKQQELFTALISGDEQAQQQAFFDFTQQIQDEILEKAETKALQNQDNAILAQRGLMKPLTSQERAYFNAVIERKGFEGIDQAFPTTVITDIMARLKKEHPLISAVATIDADVLGRYITFKKNNARAFWGQMCGDIKQIILDGFLSLDLKSARLAGFIPVCKGMLELGPEWLAQYVITVLSEIMAITLEEAIVNGDGKDKPIGMTRMLSGAVDGAYPERKTLDLKTVAGADKTFNPLVLGSIRGKMAEEGWDSSNVSIILNPQTYWSFVAPILAQRSVSNGTWDLDRMPFGEKIIKSYAVPKDIAIVGDPKNYILGVSGDMRIDRYKETLAIEDMDLFIAKLYGWGTPKAELAYQILSFAGLTPTGFADAVLIPSKK